MALSTTGSPVDPSRSTRVILPVLSGQILIWIRADASRVCGLLRRASSIVACTSLAYQPQRLPPAPPPSPSPSRPLPPGFPTRPNASPAPSPLAFRPNGPGAFSCDFGASSRLCGLSGFASGSIICFCSTIGSTVGCGSTFGGGVGGGGVAGGGKSLTIEICSTLVGAV